MRHQQHPGTPPSIKRATLGGPGDSLIEALREATLDYQLARARLEAVRRRLQGGGGPQGGIGGGYP